MNRTLGECRSRGAEIDMHSTPTRPRSPPKGCLNCSSTNSREGQKIPFQPGLKTESDIKEALSALHCSFLSVPAPAIDTPTLPTLTSTWAMRTAKLVRCVHEQVVCVLLVASKRQSCVDQKPAMVFLE